MRGEKGLEDADLCFPQKVGIVGCEGGLVLLFVFPKPSGAKRTGSSHRSLWDLQNTERSANFESTELRGCKQITLVGGFHRRSGKLHASAAVI